MDAITVVPAPANEPVHDYAPGSPERARLQTKLAELAANPTDIRQVIGGVHRTASRARRERRAAAPPRLGDRLVPATPRPADVSDAIEAASTAAPAWRDLPFDERAGVFLRAADLLAGPVARDHRRRHHAGPVQVRLPGRDRLPVRADRLLALQRPLRPADPQRPAGVLPRRLEPRRVPPARGLRLRHHPVQLLRDRRQPADRARPDGQHGDLEAVAHPGGRGLPDHAAARGGRPARPG